MAKIGLLVLTVLLSSCATTGSLSCNDVFIIYLSKADTISAPTLRQLVLHNKTIETVCNR